MAPTTELKMSGLTVAGVFGVSIFGVRADKGLVPITGSSPMCLPWLASKLIIDDLPYHLTKNIK